MPANEKQAFGDITDDALLGGRLRLRQPRRGHRFGHDAVLLAAAVSAKPGALAVELGAGVGAAGLALAARLPGVRVALVEVEPALAELAGENARRNGLDDRVRAVALDAVAAPRAFAAAGLAAGSADAVMMNPPFNDPARLQGSPDVQRRRAHAGAAELLDRWVRTAHRLLRANGTVTLIWRADGFADVLTALARGFGAVAVRPIHGKPDTPAIRVLVRAVKGERGPLTFLPGVILNDAAGRPTAEAEAVMRAAAALPFNIA
jgi:tRNA1(Val) A37 N6-methylase TrmN6